MPNTEAPASSPDTELVRELADILIETGLTEIEIERGDLKIRVVKQATVTPAAVYAAPSVAPLASTAPSAPGAPPAAPAESRGETIKSPMVGTVYLQAQPGQLAHSTTSHEDAFNPRDTDDDRPLLSVA